MRHRYKGYHKGSTAPMVVVEFLIPVSYGGWDVPSISARPVDSPGGMVKYFFKDHQWACKCD